MALSAVVKFRSFNRKSDVSQGPGKGGAELKFIGHAYEWDSRFGSASVWCGFRTSGLLPVHVCVEQVCDCCTSHACALNFSVHHCPVGLVPFPSFKGEL